MRTTGQQSVLQIKADAAAYGFREAPDVHGKIRWYIACSDCGKESSCFNASLGNVNQLLTHFTKQGWTFNRKVAQYCSTPCARMAKAKQHVRKEQEMTQQPTHTPSPPVPVTAIGPNPLILIQVITMLNEHFDKTTRLYAAGWSDERIAKEAATSLELVIKYRKEGYGELAEDPEFGKLRDDIKAMDELFSGQLKSLERSFAQQINELKLRTDRLTKTHNKASG